MIAVANFNLATEALGAVARPIENAARDYDPLLNLIGEARFCLLDEATHGTQCGVGEWRAS